MSDKMLERLLRRNTYAMIVLIVAIVAFAVVGG